MLAGAVGCKEDANGLFCVTPQRGRAGHGGVAEQHRAVDRLAHEAEMSRNLKVSDVACRCGEVRLRASGAPIIVAACHCSSCRKAGAGFASLPGSARVVNADGGTEFILFRKDRISGVRGEALFRSYRSKPGAKTRRVLARCCDTPMFLEFAGGHWLSV
jgi:hypothetical protein